MYRVDRWVRFLPQRGSDGRGLAQFWGPRARRTYQAGDPVPAWEKVDNRKLHTVNVGDIRFEKEKERPAPKKLRIRLR
jgi:hypothetical protein